VLQAVATTRPRAHSRLAVLHAGRSQRRSSANVSIFAAITVVIVSALNPALWAPIAPEGA
jgi:hypothetical protein